MCFSTPDIPPPPAPPPANPAPQPAVVAPADGTNRKDAAYLSSSRGRSSLRIDKTAPSTGSSGSGLNIPS